MHGSAARSTRPGSATRARCSRRRGSAARCPGRTAHPLERLGPCRASLSVEVAAELFARGARRGRRLDRRDRRRRRLATRRSIACSSTRPATSPAPSRRGSGSRRSGAARAHGQMLALDPPGDPTIGACIAGNLSGRAGTATARRATSCSGHARPRGRHGRERGRQGREERRRLRPGKLFCGSGGGSASSRASACGSTLCLRRRARSWSRPRTRRRRGGAASALAARSRVRSTCSARGASPRCSRARERPVAAQFAAARELVGGEEATPRSGTSRGRGRQARAAAFASLPASLERRWPALEEAVVRPAAGVAYSRGPPVTPAPTRAERLAERSARSSTRAESCAAWIRELHRRLRPLRLLPADVPDLRALARGDGLAARADLPDGGAARRDDPLNRDRGRALRPLPRLHGVRHVVPVGRPVRPADREHARLRRGAGAAPASASGFSAACSSASSPTRRGCGVALALAPLGRALPLPKRCVPSST